MGFDFNLFDKYGERMVREGLSEYLYLLMLINIWPGDWKNQFEGVNIKVDKDNWESVGMVK